MRASEHTVGGPIKHRSLSASSNNAELKHTLKHKCTTFSTSMLCHRFLMSAQFGSARYQNSLSNELISDLTSKYIDGLMHSVFTEGICLSEVKESGAQIHTIQNYIAEKTLSYYIAELFLIL